PEPSSFIARTASIASSLTSVELAHPSGASSDAENTTFDARVSSSTDSSSSAANPSCPAGGWPAASPDISREVFAPIKGGPSGCSPSHARYSGPWRPHQPGQPSADAYPSREVMKSTRSSRMVVSLVWKVTSPLLSSLPRRPDVWTGGESRTHRQHARLVADA